MNTCLYLSPLMYTGNYAFSWRTFLGENDLHDMLLIAGFPHLVVVYMHCDLQPIQKTLQPYALEGALICSIWHLTTVTNCRNNFYRPFPEGTVP